MYMEMKMHKEALAEYVRSLESRPNRFNTLYGAGLAAEKSGDMATAKKYYGQLVELMGDSPATRERAIYAQKMVAMK